MIKFCKKCNLEAEVKSGNCSSCTAIRNKIYYEKNREKLLSKQKIYQSEHSLEKKKYDLIYLEINKEKVALRAKNYYEKNKENLLPKQKIYQAEHSKEKAVYDSIYRVINSVNISKKNKIRSFFKRDALAVYNKAYNAANPDVRKRKYHNRISRKTFNGGVLSKGLVDKLLNLQKGKCACCAQTLGDNYHLDHIMPLALGGSNTDDNIQLLRATCNLQKNARHPVDFMQSRGFLL